MIIDRRNRLRNKKFDVLIRFTKPNIDLRMRSHFLNSQLTTMMSYMHQQAWLNKLNVDINKLRRELRKNEVKMQEAQAQQREQLRKELIARMNKQKSN